MKKTAILLSLFLVVFISSCEVGDIEIKKLNRGDGVWQIESMLYQNYDAAGANVVSDTTISSPGELVFFKTKTMDALWNYYMVTANMKDAGGNNVSNPGYVFYDGNRADMKEDPDPNHNFPNELEALWTVTESKRNEQIWTYSVMSATNNLATKVTMTLKKGRK